MNIESRIYFLFMEKIPLERLKWIKDCIYESLNLPVPKEGIKNKENIDNEVRFFLSGDSLFSLLDKRYQEIWTSIFNNSSIRCVLDSEELDLLGLEIQKIKKQFQSPNITIGSNLYKNCENVKDCEDFWYKLIETINARQFSKRLGFLELRGPYMSRTSVKALRLLEGAIMHQLNPQLFTYLDGIHLGHLEQHPSEFENIGEGLLSLSENVRKQNLKFTMLSCSRCGTARGYLRKEYDQKYKHSEDTISGYLFCNLNRIIDHYEEPGLILAPNWGSIQFFKDGLEFPIQGAVNSQIKPSIIAFITHSPYGSEWTFGGLSFAMACANHGISTEVVFIEDGTYCFHGTHEVSEEHKIFNIQEIVTATADMEWLRYHIFKQSLQKRGLKISSHFDDNVKKINSKELAQLILSQQQTPITHKRILFF